MTAQEYNHVFLPQINRAEEFVELFESSIEHMSDTRVDKDEVRKQFQIRGWSEETRQVILTALELPRHQLVRSWSGSSLTTTIPASL